MGTGEALYVTNIVGNVGSREPRPFEVGVYLSPDSAITTNDLRVGFRTLSALPSGQSNAAATVMTVGLQVVPGNYYLGGFNHRGWRSAARNESRM